MVDKAGGAGDVGPIRPHDKQLYEKEYQHGADLFQRALHEHAKSSDVYQKAEFKEVMDKAMTVLNETARELKAKNLIDQNVKIEKDYNEYQSHPGPNTEKTLDTDLQKAKGNFHMKGEK